MECLVWCKTCYRSASLAEAVACSPCCKCGCSGYTILSLEDCGVDALLALSEKMQRAGCWGVAEKALSLCRDENFITAADYNLSSCSLRWRMECAEAATNLVSLSDSALTVEQMFSELGRIYDDYTIRWVLSEFGGLRLVPFGDTYIVEVANGKETKR